MVNAFSGLKAYLDSQVLGQSELTEGILLALLANGHLLVEGPPGLAKTRAVNALAHGVEGRFHRIQFTPDLLPADLTGTDIYRPETGQFEFQSGPLFHHIILADEISPDNCRLWDIDTNEKMDKDRFRQGLGGEAEAYQEVARRLGLIAQIKNNKLIHSKKYF